MNFRFFGIISIFVLVLSVLCIGIFVFFPPPWNTPNTVSVSVPRVVIPRTMSSVLETQGNLDDFLAWQQEGFTVKAPLGEGEVPVAVLTGFFGGGPVEKQFVAYRNVFEPDAHIRLAYIDFDETSRTYRRVWSAQTGATRPGAINLQVLDLLGDRSVNVLLHGMNSAGERTLTIFRKNSSPGLNSAVNEENLFTRIADIRVDGVITIRETPRGQVILAGQGRGQNFTISAFGRDHNSANILDQLETIYAFNELSGLFEARNVIRIPGAQVEQHRVREILGNVRAFEGFVSGLWHFVTPQGIVDTSKFIYFDPLNREIIFHADEIQQVFNWRNSNATRYGLFVASQNASISTLRRAIDIELDSLDSIRIRVLEDVRLRISVAAPWDGIYRKAGPIPRRETPPPLQAFIDGWYEGPIGRLHFRSDGSFDLNSGIYHRQGHYAFFRVGDYELLELRSTEVRPTDANSQRDIFIVEGEGIEGALRHSLTLHRARLGANGVVRLHERPIILTLSSE